MKINIPEGMTEAEIRRRLAAPDENRLLTPAEVAQLFRVDAKTVTRWAKAGKLTCIKTLGGHRRYRESDILALIKGATVERES